MRNRTKIYYCNVILLLFVLLFVGCEERTEKELQTESPGNSSTSQPEKKAGSNKEKSPVDKKEEKLESNKESEEPAISDSSGESSEKTKNKESNNISKNGEVHALSKYSSEKIEYARVWLQLGTIKEVDELNVQRIPSGTPLNSDDETSANYPEDVIQLSGSRLVDGSVTYSGNGDGTINVYNVPLRWDGDYPAGKKFYIDIIDNTKLVSIKPGDDEKIIKLIDIMKIH